MLDKLRQRFHRKKSDSDPLAFEVIYPKEVKAPRPGANYRGSSLDFDWVVIATVCILIGIGTVMVYSASVSLADSPKYGTTSTYFLIRHIAALVVGAIAAFFVYHVPMRVWEKMAKPIGIISVILLILVLVPGIGVSVDPVPGIQSSGVRGDKARRCHLHVVVHRDAAGVHALFPEGLHPDACCDGYRHSASRAAA